MKSVDKWAEAISSAVKASEGFREAETKRQSQLIDEANLILEEAMASLKRRYEIPIFSRINIMYNHLPSNVVLSQFQTLTERSSL